MTERLQTWPEDDLADTSDLAVAHLGRLSACPFQGLMPYTEAEERYFFGRDDDLDMVVANLMASRLVVLYGPSGVGKSSLLRAGVLRQLRQLPTGGFSHLAINQAVVVYQSSWTSDPLTSVGSALREAIPPGLAADAEELVPAGAALSAGLLRRVSERLEAEVYLLFDQFEEIALYTTEPAMRAFAEELGRIVAAPGLRASVLIGIREEALAKLDRFAAHVPGILGNSLRLEHLRPDGARAAIEGPVRQYNAENGPDRAVTIEDGLVEELLAQLRTGRVAAADGGRGGIEDGRTIETPFLQLVMTRLWLEEAFAGSDALRLATLAALGGAEGIVGTHLDAVMADLPEQHLALAAQVMPYLVTPSGSKVASSAESLAYLAGLPSSGALSETLERLSGGTSQILRLVPAPAEQPGPPRYEVFHDVLCPAVLDWQRRYVAAREREAGEASLVQARQAAEL
ncbi:MAG: ATP-binding protein, partial [Micromonosporaceae bacterium]|nr:ATP-binding protein [Micromonosporaceae bacterium]